MLVQSVRFAGSVVSPEQPHPGELPQVAFAGRSNVGKSSLINRILGRTRHKVARESAEPGKTRALNFFEVNGSFFLVDLPGAGYAKVPKAVRDGWRILVESYVANTALLRGVVYLVDSRRPPTELDQRFVTYLAKTEVPVLVVLTKVDKLKARQRERGLFAEVQELLGVPEEQVVMSSTRSGEGVKTVLSAMDVLLKAKR